IQSAYPHFSWRKSMHPSYDPNTICFCIGFLANAIYFFSVLTVGLKTILTGIWGEASSALAIVWECVATCFNVSSPYKCWLPVTNQTSNVFRLGRLMLENLGVGILYY